MYQKRKQTYNTKENETTENSNGTSPLVYERKYSFLFILNEKEYFVLKD